MLILCYSAGRVKHRPAVERGIPLGSHTRLRALSRENLIDEDRLALLPGTGKPLCKEPLRLGPPLPSNYEARARELLADAQSVLDIGTDGGEVFSRILNGYEVFAVATEPWLPNVPVAARRLQRLGARAAHANSLTPPFAHQAFDLVPDRHEELGPAEIVRVLAPGGHVLTQQV